MESAAVDKIFKKKDNLESSLGNSALWIPGGSTTDWSLPSEECRPRIHVFEHFEALQPSSVLEFFKSV